MTDVPERTYIVWPGKGCGLAFSEPADTRTEYRRADLCASGQQVRALPRAVGDDLKAGWTLSFEDLQDIRDAAGDWGYTLDLKAVENIALEVERRILAALTPAPQAEGQDALKISPEYQALFDEVKLRAQPEGRDNPSGMVCAACRSVGMWHCSDPENCGGMKPMRSACTCNEPWCKACASAPTPATPTAQEAVPVGWITQPYPGVKWSFSFHEPNTLPEGWIARPLYAHPPQPSETVAEAIAALEALPRSTYDCGTQWVRLEDAIAALRALKGGDANG